MNTIYIFLILILVEATLITIGGLIFSNILGENVMPYGQQTSMESCCTNNFNCTNRSLSTPKNNATSQLDYLPFSDSVFFVITTITTIGIKKT